MVEIRAAFPADISSVVELRHQHALVQRLRLAPDARESSATELCGWLHDDGIAVLVASDDDRIVGYIVGKLQSRSPESTSGLEGVISEMTLDLHQYQGGVGRLLVGALQQWFHKCGVERILVSVPQRSPVEQAFWRGLGAVKWTEDLWIK